MIWAADGYKELMSAAHRLQNIFLSELRIVFTGSQGDKQLLIQLENRIVITKNWIIFLDRRQMKFHTVKPKHKKEWQK